VNKQLDSGKLKAIRLVGFDVDGVFTDGRFYLSDDGVESKSFHTQDGCGVRRLMQCGIEVAVISGRKSSAVEQRMQELGVQHVVLGCSDKVATFSRILDQLSLDRQQSAYVGDDLPDLPLLKHAGLSFAVANAVAEVRSVCDYTTSAKGGFGAVREICDLFCADLQR
jgi:3-deoxy-D-manno-octulosonate 8-phosphate phosphatase (KDO 8-P phosphatase)